MQIKLDRRIEESGNRTRIELFQSATLVNLGIRLVHKRCSGISGKLKSNTDFHCRRCLEGENGLFQSVLLKKVVIEPNVKLECVPKFCYLGDTLGAG